MAAETPKGKAKAGPPGPPAALPLVLGLPTEAAPLGPPAALPLVPPKAIGPPAPFGLRKPPPPAHLLLPQRPLGTKMRKPPPPAHLLLPQRPLGTKMRKPPPPAHLLLPQRVFPVIDLDQHGDAAGGDEERANAKPVPPKRKAPPPNLLSPASSSDSQAEYACPPKVSEMVAKAMASVPQVAEEDQHDGASASSASSALDPHHPNIDPRDPNIEASTSAALVVAEDPRGVEEGEEEDA